MSQTYDFYDKQAKAALVAADGAQLSNVRERELRSAKAWREMADRALLMETERAKAEIYRAERRAAETEALESMQLMQNPAH